MRKFQENGKKVEQQLVDGKIRKEKSIFMLHVFHSAAFLPSDYLFQVDGKE